MSVKRITPHTSDEAVQEMLELPHPRSVLVGLRQFVEEESLTSSSNLVVTLAEATVVGIGRVTNLELRVTGRFRRDGDLFVVTDLGIVSVSEIIRDAEAILDRHGK